MMPDARQCAYCGKVPMVGRDRHICRDGTWRANPRDQHSDPWAETAPNWAPTGWLTDAEWAEREAHAELLRSEAAERAWHEQNTDAGRIPAQREESTMGIEIADKGPSMARGASASGHPLDRLPREQDDFAHHQSMVDAWAAESDEPLNNEIHDMPVRLVLELVSLATQVAHEHERRAQQALKLAARVRMRLASLADVPEATETAEGIRARQGVQPF